MGGKVALHERYSGTGLTPRINDDFMRLRLSLPKTPTLLQSLMLTFCAGTPNDAQHPVRNPRHPALGLPKPTLFGHESFNGDPAHPYDVSADGERILVVETLGEEPDSVPAVHIILNSYEEFRDREQD